MLPALAGCSALTCQWHFHFAFFAVGTHVCGHILNADLHSHLLWNSTGLSFQDFYQQCREAFLVNSDLTLRAQLTEFRDHKLIRTKKVWLYFCDTCAKNNAYCLLKIECAFDSDLIILY